MSKISASEDKDNYGYWKVIYEKSPSEYVIVDEYLKGALIENYSLDNCPQDWEVEQAIKEDFENMLEQEYNEWGIDGIKRLLKPFSLR